MEIGRFLDALDHKAEKAMDPFVEVQKRGLEPRCLPKDHYYFPFYEAEEEKKPEVTPEVALISACKKGHKDVEALDLDDEMQWGLEPNVDRSCEEDHKAETAI